MFFLTLFGGPFGLAPKAAA